MTGAGLPLLFAAGLWAGTQNALAGGGSFVTLPALILSGLDARAANHYLQDRRPELYGPLHKP